MPKAGRLEISVPRPETQLPKREETGEKASPSTRAGDPARKAPETPADYGSVRTEAVRGRTNGNVAEEMRCKLEIRDSILA